MLFFIFTLLKNLLTQNPILKMKNLTITLLFMLFSFFSFSQKYTQGYILTNSGDTLKGELLVQNEVSASKNCIVRFQGEEEKKMYLPFEIIEYKYNDGSLFVSKEIFIDSVKAKVFLRALFKGAAELYYYPSNKKSKDVYYIEKNGEILELVNNEKDIYINGVLQKKYDYKYIGTLKHMFNDATEIYNDIDKTNFSTSSLVDITLDYHHVTCPDQHCEIFKGKGRSLYVGLNPSFKYLFSELSINETNTYTEYIDAFHYTIHRRNYSGVYTSKESYVYGLGIFLLTPSKNFKFEYSINKQTSTFTNTFNVGFLPVDYDNPDKTKHELKIEELKHQILLTYIYPYLRIKPYLGAGISLNQIKAYKDGEESLFPESSLGIVLNGGVCYDINTWITIELGCFGEYTKYAHKWWNTDIKRIEIIHKQVGVYLSANFMIFGAR